MSKKNQNVEGGETPVVDQNVEQEVKQEPEATPDLVNSVKSIMNYGPDITTPASLAEVEGSVMVWFATSEFNRTKVPDASWFQAYVCRHRAKNMYGYHKYETVVVVDGQGLYKMTLHDFLKHETQNAEGKMEVSYTCSVRKDAIFEGRSFIKGGTWWIGKAA